MAKREQTGMKTFLLKWKTPEQQKEGYDSDVVLMELAVG